MASETQRLSRVTCFVLAGGDGRRLRPLTLSTPKPLLPFGGVHRLLDFTLSNAANSGLDHAYVLTQYLGDDIGDYLRCWEHASRYRARFIHQPPAPGKRYKGTADAVAQSLRAAPSDADAVLVLSADHVYSMDYRPLLDWHIRSGIGATVAVLPVPVESASQFGIVSADPAGRIVDFVEKPQGELSPGLGGVVLASMGVYVFNLWTLWQAIFELHESIQDLDFGRDVLPWLVSCGQAAAYSVTALEDDGAFYWRDVGTLDGYYESHLDLLSGTPPLDPLEKQWPIRASIGATVERNSIRASAAPWPGSIVASPTLFGECTIERSVIGPGVTIEEGADVCGSIVLPGARIGSGASVRNTIVDAYGEVPAGEEIGYRSRKDRRRFHVTKTGIVVVPTRRRERVWVARDSASNRASMARRAGTGASGSQNH